uniref:Uncharacterized protein n=1 Tax=Romanomermis culicivorax TaxID=13658 RepID=A0A915JWH6_ROMCU
NSRKRTSIEISTCIVRNEDIVINEIKTDKQSLLILFSSTFLVSIFAIMAILGLFCKFCRTKDSKVEDQCLNNSHDTVTSMDSQDDRSIETNIPRLIAIWLKNSNIGQEMIDKILVDVENSILKFKIRARKEERKIKDYLMKTYCSFELSKNQKSNIEFVATKFIHCKMWHEICTKIHSILETNVHQGQQLCRNFFRLLQNQLAMQSMRRRLSKIQQGMLRSMLDAMKETAMEYCSRALKNQERFQNNIESVFDSAVVEFQLLNDVMQKHIFEKQEVEMCNFYSIFENLGVEPDKWLPKIREIRSKLLIKINEQDNQLKTEQYFQILEKFIEKCSSLPSLLFQEEESLKNLKAALIFKMMQMKEKMMQIELNFDQELKKLEQKLENRVHIVPQYTRKAMSLSRDEQSLLLYCENDLSTMIGDVEKFSCHVIDSGDQIDHDQDQKFESYLQYFFAKQQASKVDQLSQLKFDTWCLETLISCLISYISKYKLTTESILQKVRDDHDVEFNFLYNHLLNKKQEEEN